MSAVTDCRGGLFLHWPCINSKLVTNYLDAANTAHLIIDSMQKKGPSGSSLVGLFATLDDLSLDAANASVLLLKNDLEQLAEETVEVRRPRQGRGYTYAA